MPKQKGPVEDKQIVLLYEFGTYKVSLNRSKIYRRQTNHDVIGSHIVRATTYMFTDVSNLKHKRLVYSRQYCVYTCVCLS